MNWTTIIDPPVASDWDAFVESVGGHLLQSYAWGQFKADYGWRARRIALAEGDGLLAAAQVLVRPLPGGRSLGYIPRGPVTARPDEARLWDGLLEAIHAVAGEERAIFLRLEPDAAEEQLDVHLFTERGFRQVSATIQPRTTLWVDLDSDENKLLARMKPKTRYNIRLAERQGVRVRLGTAEDFPAFHRLLEITGRRDGFGVRPQGYYIRAWRLFAPEGRCRMFIAEYEGQLLAGLMAFAFGRRAWYLYGASADEQRQRMPNYLLQWEAMRWAKGRGCALYDLWGIPDEVGRSGEPPDFAQRREGLWGVYRFKRGFGGRVVRHSPAFDYVYSPLWYTLLLNVAPRLRATTRGLWEGW
ncbi:MAG: peptidoglycan bridge formation glycyltransferase FemA/FemB family protein [Chloroflexi bacterium]|nr:peptidoglycan bridge formation glycyltransferase FemA/FemB family protein [Chloroflexota bacterium]